MVVEEFCTKTEISMMDSGAKDKFMDLESSKKIKQESYTKAFGSKDNLFVPFPAKIHFSLTFLECYISKTHQSFSRRLIWKNLFFLTLFIWRWPLTINYVSILVNIISRYHFSHFLVFIVTTILFVGISHVVDKYVMNFLQYIFA